MTQAGAARERPHDFEDRGREGRQSRVYTSMSVGQYGTVEAAAAAAAEILILNQTGEPVWFVQVAPNGAREWGVESLDSGISAGGEQRWRVPSGYYQLRAETASGETVTHFGLRLKEGQRAVWILAAR